MNVSKNYNNDRKYHCGLPDYIPFALLCLLTGFAQAAEAGQQLSDPLATAGLSQVITGLLLVIIVIFVITWIIRRVPGLQRVGQGAIRIIDSLHVSPRERILLVEINEQQLLLGVTGQNISTLYVLPEPVSRVASQSEVANRLVNLFSSKAGKASP